MAAPPLPPLTPAGDHPPPAAPGTSAPSPRAGASPGTRERLRALVAAGMPSPVVLAAVVAALAASGLALAALLVARAPAARTDELLPFTAGAHGPAPAATGTATGASAAVAVSQPAPTTTAPPLTVHAAGAVARPGVYVEAAGARVADLVAAAGGPAPDADLERVNLAAALVDGQRVYVPRVGKTVPAVVAGEGSEGAAVPSAGTVSAAGGSAASSAPVDLNAATAEQLDALPGIGPATAAAIVTYRSEHGPFRSVSQLLDVPGIGDAKLAALRPRVRV